MAQSEKVDSPDHALVSLLGHSSTGKIRSRGNNRRPGLTAETVVQGLEEEADYKAFELSVTSGFDAQTAVERELVLRLASLLWRLRRAAAIETGALRISGQLNDNPGLPQLSVLEPFCGIGAKPRRSYSKGHAAKKGGRPEDANQHNAATRADESQDLSAELAARYLRLDFFDCGALERLGRYEAGLWKQVGQLIATLNWLPR